MTTTRGTDAGVACLVSAGPADDRALSEAAAWRQAIGGRLTVLFGLPTPLCLTSPEGGMWCDEADLLADAAQSWLADRVADLPTHDLVLLPEATAASVCEWARTARPRLLVVGRVDRLLQRLLAGDPAGQIARHAPCPVLVVGDDGARPKCRCRDTRKAVTAKDPMGGRP